MKKIGTLTVLLLGLLLFAVARYFPVWADPGSPASTYLSPHFIEQTMAETSVPNVVSAVLADYRGFDTMFETVVVFCAGMACFFILSSFRPPMPEYYLYRHIDTGVVLKFLKGRPLPPPGSSFEYIDPNWTPYDFIVSRVAKLLIPFILLFGLYVIAHGHHSPGGGFQGGVILAAAYLLLALSHNLRTLSNRLTTTLLGLMSAGGIIIYAGWGVLAMLYGGNFLDYAALKGLLGVGTLQARSLGILIVEIGVGLTVMSTMILLYKIIASRGRFHEGL